jgi:basic membrane protein A and related proteins
VSDLKAGKKIANLVRGGLKEGFVKPSPYGPAVGEEAKKAADAVKAKFLNGSFVIFQGPLKDNAGNVVISEGNAYVQTAIELESMDYLVEGVIGQ